MRLNSKFGKIVILGGALCLGLGGAVYGLWVVFRDSQVPALTAAEIESMVRVGMTEGEVKEALGDPIQKVEGGWIYHNKPNRDSPSRIFIIFKEGRVSDFALKTPSLHSRK